MTAKIAINGYGTIGKRVADAVAAQDDMRVAGVAKTKPDFEAKLAIRKGYPLYAPNADVASKFEKAGVKTAGTLEDLAKAADLVVDCTPEESGYKSLYEKAGVKAIWQGGEDHGLTNLSFNAAANYEECLGARFVRVPSCNTTGLIRTLYPLDAHFGVVSVLAVMVRRATDPGDSKKGPINAIEPELEMPSHHGPDVQSVLPKLNIHTIAVKVPTTIMQLHTVIVDLKKAASAEAVLDVWKRVPRVAFVSGGDGVVDRPDHGDGPGPFAEPRRSVRDRRVERRRSRRRRETPVLFPSGPSGIGCRAGECRCDSRAHGTSEGRPQKHGEDGPEPRNRHRKVKSRRSAAGPTASPRGGGFVWSPAAGRP